MSFDGSPQVLVFGNKISRVYCSQLTNENACILKHSIYEPSLLHFHGDESKEKTLSISFFCTNEAVNCKQVAETIFHINHLNTTLSKFVTKQAPVSQQSSAIEPQWDNIKLFYEVYQLDQ